MGSMALTRSSCKGWAATWAARSARQRRERRLLSPFLHPRALVRLCPASLHSYPGSRPWLLRFCRGVLRSCHGLLRSCRGVLRPSAGLLRFSRGLLLSYLGLGFLRVWPCRYLPGCSCALLRAHLCRRPRSCFHRALGECRTACLDRYRCRRCRGPSVAPLRRRQPTRSRGSSALRARAAPGRRAELLAAPLGEGALALALSPDGRLALQALSFGPCAHSAVAAWRPAVPASPT